MARFSSSALASFCRMVRVGLDAGLPITHVFRKQSERGPFAMRKLSGRLADELEAGESLTDAIALEGHSLPPLFVALTEVGETTGNLGSAFRELEEYFDLQVTLRNNFRRQIFMPLMQFFAAIFVICLMLLIMGWLDLPMDPLGIGVGWPGVFRFLLIVGAIFGAIYLVILGIARRVRFLAPVERMILATPVLGPALETLLLGRFCVSLRYTLGAGLPVRQALRHSFDATASQYYLQSYQKAEPGLKRGDTVVDVLEQCQIFPREFLDIVANAEEAGQIPEVMDQQANYYQEEASRRLQMLAQIAGWVVYGMVALFIIYLIFTLYARVYFPRIEMIK